MRYVAVLTIATLTLSSIAGAEKPVNARSANKDLQFLEQAIENLRQGGFHDEAAKLHHQAEELHQQRQLDEERRVALQEKRQELHSLEESLDQLRKEIQELQAATGPVGQFQLHMLCIEARGTARHEALQAFSSDQPDGDSPHLILVNESGMGKLKEWTAESPEAKVVSRPVVVTSLGRPASVQIGEQVPFLWTPIGEDKSRLEFQETGTKIHTRVTNGRSDRFRLEFSAEFTQLLADSGVKTASAFSVPGVQTRRFQTEAELLPEQTALMRLPMSSEDAEERLFLLAVTLTLARPAAVENKPAGVSFVPRKHVPHEPKHLPDDHPVPMVDAAPVKQIQLSCLCVEFDGTFSQFLPSCCEEDSAVGFGNIHVLDKHELTLVREQLEKNHAGAKILADPVLVTTEHRPARFHTGGEIPILVPTSESRSTIEWRDIGMMLQATATQTGENQFHIEMEAEFSKRESDLGIAVDGLVVPGLTTRRINTRAELEQGQTVAIELPPGANKDPTAEKTYLFLVTPTAAETDTHQAIRPAQE